MHDKNFYIDPLNTNFPEPDIGVDYAWISMQKMLDGPTKRTTLMPLCLVKFFHKIWLPGTILLITAWVMWFYVADKPSKNTSLEKISSNNYRNYEKKQEVFSPNSANQSSKINQNSNLTKVDTIAFFFSDENQKSIVNTNNNLHSNNPNLRSSPKNEFSKSLPKKEIKIDLADSTNIVDISNPPSNNPGLKGNSETNKKLAKKGIVKNTGFNKSDIQETILNSGEINNSNKENEVDKLNKRRSTKNLKEKIQYDNNKSKPESNDYKNIIKLINKDQRLGKTKKYTENFKSFIEINITPSTPITITLDSSFIDTSKKDLKLQVKPKQHSQILKKLSENLLKNKISIGLQWNLPITNGVNYFTNINAKNQPYQLFIPTFWTSKKINRNEIMFSFTPIQQNYTDNKIMDTVTAPAPAPVPVPGPSPVSSNPYPKTQRLLKTFGFSAGLSYNYYVTPSFSIGLGLKYNRQNLALQRDVTFSLITRTQISDTMFILRKSSPDWNYLKPYFISGQLELAYTKKKFSSGFNISAPITNLSIIDKENLRPINSQLFIRWKIF